MCKKFGGEQLGVQGHIQYTYLEVWPCKEAVGGAVLQAASAGEPRKRPAALQLPPEADSPLAVLLARLDDSASAQHSSGATPCGTHSRQFSSDVQG